MKRFEIHFKGFLSIEAENLQDANEKFTNLHPDKDATNFVDEETLQEHEVIGFCEVSRLAIFEGDKYSFDKEGIMWLDEEMD